MKKYAFPLALAVGVVAVMATVFYLHREPEAPVAEPSALPAPASVNAPPAQVPDAVTTEQPAPAPRASASPAEPAAPPVQPAAPRPISENEVKLRAATDYLAFAREMLPKAKAGDRDAQYQLYKAMDYCRTGYRDVFDEGKTRRSLEDVLNAGALPARQEQEIRELHSRCQGLMTAEVEGLGEAQQWLTRSATAGDPRAQVQLAERMAFMSAQLSGPQSTRSMSDARRFARDALATRDPEVVWRAGAMAASGLGPAGVDAKAWTQAACDRGLDCGPGSEPARQLCREVPNCLPSESVYDILRRSVDDPAALAENAKRVNALIDARDWRGLGLEEPPPGP